MSSFRILFRSDDEHLAKSVPTDVLGQVAKINGEIEIEPDGELNHQGSLDPAILAQAAGLETKLPAKQALVDPRFQWLSRGHLQA